MSESIGKSPYQPDDFLREHRAVIHAVFPDFFQTGDSGDNEAIDPELQYKTLEDKVLNVTSHEPAMQQLGRERFMNMPQGQRFQLVKDSLQFIEAIQDAGKQIVE